MRVSSGEGQASILSWACSVALGFYQVSWRRVSAAELRWVSVAHTRGTIHGSDLPLCAAIPVQGYQYLPGFLPAAWRQERLSALSVSSLSNTCAGIRNAEQQIPQVEFYLPAALA